MVKKWLKIVEDKLFKTLCRSVVRVRDFLGSLTLAFFSVSLFSKIDHEKSFKNVFKLTFLQKYLHRLNFAD